MAPRMGTARKKVVLQTKQISVCAKKLRKALLSVYSVFLDNPLSYTVIIVQTL